MKRLSPGVRFLLGFITFLLCVALFVTTFAGILVSNFVQILSSQDNLQTMLRQVLFVDLKQPATVRSAPAMRATPTMLLAPGNIRLNDQSTASSMVDWIYEALAEDFGDELQVDLETVKDFVERSTLDDFLVEKGAGLISDVYTGESTVTLSADEIQAKIEENADLIEEVFGVPVDMEVVTNVTSVIEENEYVSRIEEEGIVNIIMSAGGSTEEGMENPNSADIQQVQEILDTTRMVLSVQTVLIFVGAILLLIVLILVVNMKQIWAGLNAIGITAMLAALPYVVLTLLPAGFISGLGLPAMAEIVANTIIGIGSVIYYGVFGFGLAMLIAGIVTFCIFRSKCKKAAALAEIEEAVIAEAPLAEVEFPAEEAAEEAAEETEEVTEEATEEEEEEAEEAAEEEETTETV